MTVSKKPAAQSANGSTASLRENPQSTPTNSHRQSCSPATLIRQLPNGRLTQAKNGDILLTLRFRLEEEESVTDSICLNSYGAQLAMTDWLGENQLGSENQEDTMEQ